MAALAEREGRRLVGDIDFYVNGTVVEYTRYFEPFTGEAVWDGLL